MRVNIRSSFFIQSQANWLPEVEVVAEVVWIQARRCSIVVQGNRLDFHNRRRWHRALCLSEERRGVSPTRHPRWSDTDEVKGRIARRLDLVLLRRSNANIKIEEEPDISAQGKGDVFNVCRLIKIDEQTNLRDKSGRPKSRDENCSIIPLAPGRNRGHSKALLLVERRPSEALWNSANARTDDDSSPRCSSVVDSHFRHTPRLRRQRGLVWWNEHSLAQVPPRRKLTVQKSCSTLWPI